MSFTIESVLPAPSPVFGQRRKDARNGGRPGRDTAWSPRCGNGESHGEEALHGQWEVRCERDRLAGLDEMLSYLETQAMALDALEAVVPSLSESGEYDALSRRFTEIAGETFNGVRLLGGEEEVRLLGLHCPEVLDVLAGGRLFLQGSNEEVALPCDEATPGELLLRDIARLRSENDALREKIRCLRNGGGIGVEGDPAGARESLFDMDRHVFRDSSEVYSAQAHAMNAAVLRLID